MSRYLRIVIVFIISIVAFTHNSPAQQQYPRSVAKKFLSYMGQDSFKAAALLFHYPSSFTEKQKNDEIKSVEQSLKEYKEKFGEIIETGNYTYNGQLVGVGVSGATIEYWQQYKKESPQVVLPSKFQVAGWGFVRIVLCNIDNKWEIQGLDYSFPASEKSKALIQKIK